MPFSPRANEKQAVKDILDSDEYETADKMADAVVRQVFDLIQGRRESGLWMVWVERCPIGPFASEVDARKYAARVEEEQGLRCAPAPLWTPAIYTEALEHQAHGVCACGHASVLHLKGRCAVYLRAKELCRCGNGG